MRRWIAIPAFALIACAQQGANPVASDTASPAQVVSPVFSASPTPAISPTLAALPFPDLPVTTVAFSCRLPIYQPGSTIEDSFISFPSGSVAIDPNGKNGMYFDRAYSLWLPVPRSAVSPDGGGYAYIENGDPGVFFIHIVGVNSNQSKDTAFRESASASGFGAEPEIFDYSADGIYLTEAFEHVWPGVWWFDQRTLLIHKVADIQTPEVSAGSGVIWFGAVNPADANPLSTGTSAGILPDEVNRLDAKTGSQAQWLYRPGIGLEVLGVDTSGHPLIRVLTGIMPSAPKSDPINHSASELLIALDDKTQRSIYKGQLVETLSMPVADSHGVWFGSDQGIYLYSGSGGLQKVSDHPGYPANGCF